MRSRSFNTIIDRVFRLSARRRGNGKRTGYTLVSRDSARPRVNAFAEKFYQAFAVGPFLVAQRIQHGARPPGEPCCACASRSQCSSWCQELRACGRCAGRRNYQSRLGLLCRPSPVASKVPWLAEGRCCERLRAAWSDRPLGSSCACTRTSGLRARIQRAHVRQAVRAVERVPQLGSDAFDTKRQICVSLFLRVR